MIASYYYYVLLIQGYEHYALKNNEICEYVCNKKAQICNHFFYNICIYIGISLILQKNKN